jgi:hypothetical protein
MDFKKKDREFRYLDILLYRIFVIEIFRYLDSDGGITLNN